MTSRIGTAPPAPVDRPITHVYDAAYRGVPNWDIGRPQRPFVDALELGLVRSPVLDVGCGTGELSMFYASAGLEVLGIDLSAVAVGTARERARWRRLDARFLVWDALDLPRLADRGLSVRTVVDSAMFHVLAPSERDRFVAGLGRVLSPGGCYLVLGDRRVGEAAYGLSVEELRARFDRAGGWRLLGAFPTRFERRWSASDAVFAVFQRP